MNAFLRAAALVATGLSVPIVAHADDLGDEIIGYMDFATYESGIIFCRSN